MIDQDKNNARAYAYCGMAYRELKQYKDARTYFTRALARGYSRLWIVQEFEYLHNVHKKEIRRYYGDGMKYMRAKRYEDAVRRFSEIMAMDKNDARAVIYRGAAYLRWKKEDKAQADFMLLLTCGYSQPWIKQELKKASPADKR